MRSAAEHNREDIIERWMLKIAMDGGVERFDDLHIDAIDPGWKNKDEWIESGLKAFHIAVGTRNRNNMPYSVGLGFSLLSSEEVGGVSFRTKEEFRAQLDSSPPSLYLFPQGHEARTQSGFTDFQPVDAAILGVTGGAHCYLWEFKQTGANEHHRSVFVEG